MKILYDGYERSTSGQEQIGRNPVNLNRDRFVYAYSCLQKTTYGFSPDFDAQSKSRSVEPAPEPGAAAGSLATSRRRAGLIRRVNAKPRSKYSGRDRERHAFAVLGGIELSAWDA